MNMDTSAVHLSALTLMGVVTLVGFYAGGLARKAKLPSLIGYMVLGVLLGPSLFGLFNEANLDHMGFITELSLGFVAFSIGAELSIVSLKRLGRGIVTVIFTESLCAFFAVLALVYILTRDLPMSLVFGAMAPASAPAGTVAVIQEYKAKGNLTKALYAVVGFDDGLAIIIFGFASALAQKLLIAEATGEGGSLMPALVIPTGEIILSLVVGAVVGFVFCRLVRNLQAPKDIFIMLFGTVLLTTGLALQLHLSLIMTNMVVGFVMVNTRREAFVHRVTAPLLEVMPLLFILFFCLAGAHLQVRALPSLGLLGAVYILGRSVGLVGGARLGATLGRLEDNVRKYLGLGILSQAGVAIGLALIVKHEFDQLSAVHGHPHAAAIGTTVLTSITATCIFFEVIGPILTKVALHKAGEIPQDPAVSSGAPSSETD